jgi:flagellar basal body rod protein FlgB
MDVIGNNIANVNTYGFKSSRATFSDVYYQNLAGSKAGQAQTTGGKTPPLQRQGSQPPPIQNIKEYLLYDEVTFFRGRGTSHPPDQDGRHR